MLDQDLDCAGVIVYGTLLWDITVADTTLSPHYVLVEGQGKFLIGSKDAPMLKPATIYIKEAACRWSAGACTWFDASAKGSGPAACSAIDAALKKKFTFAMFEETVLTVKAQSGICMSAPQGSNNGGKLQMADCSSGAVDRITWSYDKDSGLVRGANGGCVDQAGPHIWSCNKGNTNQQFDFNEGTGQFVHRHTGKCLAAGNPGKAGDMIKMVVCSAGSAAQKWALAERKVSKPKDPLAYALAQGQCESAWVHPHVGKRFVAGYNGLTQSFSGVADAKEFAAVAGTTGDGKGPEIMFYGAPSRKAWGLVGSVTEAGERGVHMKEDVESLGWRNGDEVAIAYMDGSLGHRSTIAEIRAKEGEIVLADPVPERVQGGFKTYSGVKFEVAAEVMNLERSIKITGDTRGFDDGAKEGLHVMMFGGKMAIDSTRVEYCGQRGVLGRYCLHWHYIGSCPDCKFTGNAIVEGQTKGVTIHGTHGISPLRDSCYEILVVVP